MTKFKIGLRHALCGIALLLREKNFLIHIVATITVLGFSYSFSISYHEWLAVILCIGSVLGAEALNTAIEQIADFVHPEEHASIKNIKDISAGAVFLLCLAALTIGIIVFAPKIHGLTT